MSQCGESFTFEDSSSLKTPETKTAENLGDSGYAGLHTTPRYFKPRLVRKTKLEFSADHQQGTSGQWTGLGLYRSLLPYSVPTILPSRHYRKQKLRRLPSPSQLDPRLLEQSVVANNNINMVDGVKMLVTDHQPKTKTVDGVDDHDL